MSDEEMISILDMVTGYSFEYLKSLTTGELVKLYDEKTGYR